MNKILETIEISIELNKGEIEREVNGLMEEDVILRHLCIMDDLNYRHGAKLLIGKINELIEDNKVINIQDYKNKDKQFLNEIEKFTLSREEAFLLLQVLISEISHIQRLKNSIKGGILRVESIDKPIPDNILDDKLLVCWNTYKNLEFFRYEFKIEEYDSGYELWLHVLELEYIVTAISNAIKVLINTEVKETTLDTLRSIESKVENRIIEHEDTVRRFNSQHTLNERIEMLTSL